MSKAVKVQITMDESLLSRLDDFVDRNFSTRSGAIALACTQMLLSDDIRVSIRTIANAMKRIAESNEIDEQSKEDFKQFELLAKALSENPQSLL